jgi:hypothetical protein
MIYANDVNLLGDNINNIKKNTENITAASKEISLEVNTEKSKYMWTSQRSNAGQNHKIKVANRSIETVTKSKYLGTTVKKQNLIIIIIIIFMD